jgi:hypothetical protein
MGILLQKMRRISAYIISIVIIIFCSILQINGQDTINYPLKIKVGMEISGPIIYSIDNNILITEGFVSVDLNEVKSVILAGGYADYNYSQYNYTYNSNGIFVRAGIDFNLMKPKKTKGLYWGGIGFRYGISHFTYSIPFYKQDNYWGTTESSVSENKTWAHFIEATPGIRAEVFKNVSMGWSVNLRMLLYSGTGKNLKAIYIPGFGPGEKNFNIGMSYFLSWNIPYKKIRVIIKKPEPEEPEETEEGTAGK